MLKCILIYLWIYIGLYYVIEAADSDEHVHIKLHMPSGQRKHTHHHTHHHKKRQYPLPHHSSPTSTHHHGAGAAPPPTPHLYHEIPQNYHSQSQQQNNIKKLPPHLHESGQLQLEELTDVYSSNSDHSRDNEDTENGGEHMMIPSYLAENFALFPQPTVKTTYETNIIPQHLQGFQHSQYPHPHHHPPPPHNVVDLHDEEEDNEITGLGGEDVRGEGMVMLTEEADNYHSHKPFAQELSSSSKIRQKEQLLQQILQQQEIINSAKFRGNKYGAENDYHSEDDMTETMMYSSEPHIPLATTTTTISSFAKGTDDIGVHTGIKALTVDDIWSQLQRQYLNKYAPQAQALTADEDLNQQTTIKNKRTTKRQRHIKPAATTSPSSSSFSSFPLSSTTSSRQSTSSFWPAKTLNYDNNHYHQQKQQSHYDDNHSSSLPSSFVSSSTSYRDTDLFDDTRALSRPYNNFNGHNIAATAATVFHGNNGASDEDAVAADDDDSAGYFNHDDTEDDGSSHDTSFHENVYHQRGKKFIGNTGHIAYGNSNTNNPFNYHDLYASYSTPVTATVATKIHPSTYHPKLGKTATTTTSSTSSILPTLSHESTSYQWHTQQHNNPVSYQSYHLQHQQQQQQQQKHQQQQPHQYQQQQQHYYRQHHPQSSALRLPKATITQMPNTVSTSTSSLSPTLSNDFTSDGKSAIQPTSRYKKRKNRIKTKRNRIVVI